MSGREFTISDLPKIGSYVTVHPKEDWGPGLVTHSRLKFIEIVWACEGGETSMSWSGKNVKTGLSFIKPPAQPHVAAGSGWRERMRNVIHSYGDIRVDGIGGLGEAWTEIHELLDEVVELPEPTEYKAVKMNNGLIGTADLGLFLEREEALQLAAALIRAATQSPAKPPQA